MTQDLSRDAVIARIRTALKARSGKQWSVTGGSGTACGWITITTPPRLRQNGDMTEAQRAELGALLGLGYVHQQGYKVASSHDYYREAIDRAEGRTPTVIGEPYWD